MEIIKRDQSVQAYDRRKISRAVSAAFDSVGHPLPDMKKEAILDQVEVQIRTAAEMAPVSVEQIQDWVEQALMRQDCYEEARHYILYRPVSYTHLAFVPHRSGKSDSCQLRDRPVA